MSAEMKTGVIPMPRVFSSGARDLLLRAYGNGSEILRSAGKAAPLRMTPIQ
jgi:hypothetical protein